uniref:Uncharacterized protein n=1 Tax=Anguilla anguilla TaxID=7936 RepID=A0A0E9UUW3_ANGAN
MLYTSHSHETTLLSAR